MINEKSNQQKEILGKREVRLDDSSFIKEGKHRYETIPQKIQQISNGNPSRQTKLDDQLYKLRKNIEEMSQEDLESDNPVLQHTKQEVSKFIQMEGRNSNTQSEHFDRSENFSASLRNDISCGKLISSSLLKSGISNTSWIIANQDSTFNIKDDDEDEMEDFENYNWDDQIQQHIVKMMGTQNGSASKGSMTVQECLNYLQSQKLKNPQKQITNDKKQI